MTTLLPPPAAARPPGAAAPPPARRRHRPGYAETVLLVTLLVGLPARLVGIWSTPLWRDEAFTGLVARRPLGSGLDVVRHDSAPPLFYVLTRAVATVSTSPLALRLLPALAGAAVVPVVAALSRRIGGDRAGLLGAVAAALLPALVLPARDARMYALATTLVTLAALLLWRAVERPTRARLALYALCVGAAVNTHYLTALAVLAAMPAMLVLRPPRPTVRAVVLAALAGLATLLPWLVYANGQAAHGAEGFWARSLSPDSALSVLTGLLAGPTVDAGLPGRVQVMSIQGVTLGAVGVALVPALLRLARGADRHERRATLYCLGAGVGAVLLLLLVSLWRPLVEARYAGALWGPAVALVGAGLARLRPARLLAPLALLPVGAATVALVVAPMHPDVPAVVRLLDGRVGPADQVAVTRPSDFLVVLYYADTAAAPRAHVIAGSVPWYWGTAAFPPGSVTPSIADRGGTVYVVRGPDDPVPALPPGYRRTASQCVTAVCLDAFSR